MGDGKVILSEEQQRINRITETIIGGAFAVSNGLGVGFLEKVYENALAVELRQRGLNVIQQAPVVVRYNGVLVGDYVADLLVEDVVLVELKVTRALDEIHMAQCMNYLRATGLTACLLLNFGKPRLEIKRIVNTF